MKKRESIKANLIETRLNTENGGPFLAESKDLKQERVSKLTGENLYSSPEN